MPKAVAVLGAAFGAPDPNSPVEAPLLWLSSLPPSPKIEPEEGLAADPNALPDFEAKPPKAEPEVAGVEESAFGANGDDDVGVEPKADVVPNAEPEPKAEVEPKAEEEPKAGADVCPNADDWPNADFAADCPKADCVEGAEVVVEAGDEEPNADVAGLALKALAAGAGEDVSFDLAAAAAVSEAFPSLSAAGAVAKPKLVEPKADVV